MHSVKYSMPIATMLVAVSTIIAPISNSLFGDQSTMDRPTMNQPRTDQSTMEDRMQQRRPTASPATLYFHPSCTHCHKVVEYLKQQNKSVAIKDISNPLYMQEFQNYGQRGVPVLVVGSQVITGADQIMNYLKQHPEILR